MEVNQILQGNCLDILKRQPDNFIDSVVTDPPYGLSNHDESIIREVLQKWLSGNEDYIPSLKGFMDKEWDAFVPPPRIWKEVYRVMKPGAYIICFAGTRTVDLMSMSLRLAGFELKDMLLWVYSSGFPKGLNISKGIINSMGNISKAKQWEGWNTALKPALEPIILAQKPISEKTIVENVLKWGTGGLNIDKCRVGKREKTQYSGARHGQTTCYGKFNYDAKDVPLPEGRFPSNLILECYCDTVLEGKDEIVKIHDAPAGTFAGGEAGRGSYKNYRERSVGKSVIHTNPLCPCYILDTQQKGVSRFFQQIHHEDDAYVPFFYCPKANKDERNRGLEELSKKETQLTLDGWVSKEKNFVKQHNNHPTVKPLQLTQYLVRLITPPKGIVLDPFCGSGTTLIACILEDKRYIGIEFCEEYYNIALKRIQYFTKMKLEKEV